MFFLILLSLLIANAQAQVPEPNNCKQRKVMAHYDPSKILGQWYGYSYFPNCAPHGRCRRTEFIDDHEGSMITIEKQVSATPGTFDVYRDMQISKYIGNSVYLLIGPKDAVYLNQTNTVWSTDYVSYLLKGGCVNVGSLSLNYAWVLTRSPNPSQSVVAKINEALKVEEIQTKYLVKYNQTDCNFDY